MDYGERLVCRAFLEQEIKEKKKEIEDIKSRRA